MISFDDYGGSGGGSDVDLSPIYLSLGVLKSNTHMMWDFMSTISNTTISYSTPYLESYRTTNESYMYNITGLLPTLFTNDSQVINGIMYGQNINVGDGNFNYGLTINQFDELLNCTFSNNTLSLIGNDFRTLSFKDILYLELKCRSLEMPTFNSITNASIYATNVSGDFVNNFINNKKMYFIGCGTFSLNAFSVGTILHVNDYESFIYNSVKKISSMNLRNISDVMGNELYTLTCMNVVGENFRDNTISLCQDVYLSNFSMTNNLISSVNKLNIEGYNLSLNTLVGMTKANIDFMELDSVSIESIKNLNLNLDIIKSLTLSANGMMNLKFCAASSIIVDCPSDQTCDVCLYGESLEKMTVSKPKILMHGSVKTLDDIQFSEGSVNLSCDVLWMCALHTLKGVISAKTISLCDFSQCHDLTIYADWFAGEVKRCWDIKFYCDTIKNAVFDSVSTMFLSFNHFTTGGRPEIYNAYNMTFYKDLQELTVWPTSNKPLSLLQGSNWLGTLWLKSEISEARGALSKMSLVGITITQDYDFTHCPIICDYKSAVN